MLIEIFFVDENTRSLKRNIYIVYIDAIIMPSDGQFMSIYLVNLFDNHIAKNPLYVQHGWRSLQSWAV